MPKDNALTIVLIARIPPNGVAAFQAYEATVLPLVAAHGGRLERRLRDEQGTVEVHIVSFPSDAEAEAYRGDPRRTAAAPLFEASSAKIDRFFLRDVLPS